MRITLLSALEILDSRGFPTLEVTLEAGSLQARAAVPSGKSTGKNEALELRDGDKLRFQGKGVLKAIASVEGEITAKLLGQDLPPQAELDRMLIELDGTPGKTRLGANAILGVSMAAARLRAQAEGQPLYASLGGPEATLLPVPCFNVLNGGAHADNPLEFQEFMLAPAGRPTFAEALRAGAETYHALAGILKTRGLSISVGDEGGFAPHLTFPEEAMDLMVEAIAAAGYQPGKDIFIALDPAASGFFKDGRYRFGGEVHTAEAMTERYGSWLNRYPLLSIEDGLAEDDDAGWIHMTKALGSRMQIVGDDNFVSDPRRVEDAIQRKIGNAVLLKPNQIGTVTEITETAKTAMRAGYRCMASHRSGETTDDFIADLTVALGVGQIKSGAPARGERLAKYNRLVRIERELGSRARFAGRGIFGGK
jgi:enolase